MISKKIYTEENTMVPVFLEMLEIKEDNVKITTLYQVYSALVFKIAKDYLKNEQDAEDALQDTFIKIIKNIDNIDEIRSYKTKRFIVVIVQNICKDLLKHNKIMRTLELEKMQYNIDLKDNVQNHVIHSMSLEIIYKVVNSLEPIYQEIFILRYYNQLSYDEISSILNITNATSRKRVQRAKIILEKKIKRMII